MTKTNSVLGEGARLHALGFAIHWLHPKSKRPVESGWTKGPRKTWPELRAAYRDGMNIGVRLGEASEIGFLGYLACIDVDVKGGDAKPALAALRRIINGHGPFPEVHSGSGNGSRHLYCVTIEPFKMIELEKHADWEICAYSQGRQMVLPPSIHPNGKPYIWKASVDGSFPLMEFARPEKAAKTGKTEGRDTVEDFEVSPVVLDWLDVSKKIKAVITKGVGVTDRSASLLPAVTALHSAGCSKNEILTILTERDTFLGACAYDHAQTGSRRAAANWLWNYTVKKVIDERDAGAVFTKVLSNGSAVDLLSDEALAAQTEEFKAEIDWKSEIMRGGQNGDGAPKPNVWNVIHILKNAVAPEIFRRNTFAFRDTYSLDVPWGGKKEDLLCDDDVPKIKYWLSQNYRFEPGKVVIEDAMTVMACEHAYDPVKTWLNELPGWDGKTRLDFWLERFFEAEGDADYLGQVFRKWMVAMVMRVYRPGSKFDWMPIFEGAQGIGKSSFGRLLCGDKYFLDWLPNLADKDSALALQGMWMVEMAELSSFRKNELESIKGFLTRTVDKVRAPYGKRWAESARRCVFFGTTNKETYLRDESGNRRFKPVKVGELDFAQLAKDRLQLFAEARHLFKTGEETERSLEISGEAKLYELSIQRDKMVEDDASIMAELLKEFFKAEMMKSKTERFVFNKFKLHSLFDRVQGIGRFKLDARNSQFASKALKSLGAEKWKSDGGVYWKIEEEAFRV